MATIYQQAAAQLRSDADEGAPQAPHISESADYLSRQLITYIGNKRGLLGQIGAAVEYAKRRLGKPKLRTLDAFSGSGVVSRCLKAHSSLLVSNDFEDYAAVIGRCFLSNRSEVDIAALTEIVADMNRRAQDDGFQRGFIEELYAPKDEANITAADRVFYTKRNARLLDNYRRLIDRQPQEYRDLLLGPLLSEASVRSNTAGVFKGFYKNRKTGIGQYGGTGKDALTRIRGGITLAPPVLSRFECEYRVLQLDANEMAGAVGEMDFAYVDPPYNQHPYGSNYFMLNLLTNYRRPRQISRVSGIPSDWKRSGYNVRSKSFGLLMDLLERIDAPFILVSFNSEGFIPRAELEAALARLGVVQQYAIPYNTYRGSRNLCNRDVHVTEHMFLIERG